MAFSRIMSSHLLLSLQFPWYLSIIQCWKLHFFSTWLMRYCPSFPLNFSAASSWSLLPFLFLPPKKYGCPYPWAYSTPSYVASYGWLFCVCVTSPWLDCQPCDGEEQYVSSAHPAKQFTHSCSGNLWFDWLQTNDSLDHINRLESISIKEKKMAKTNELIQTSK